MNEDNFMPTDAEFLGQLNDMKIDWYLDGLLKERHHYEICIVSCEETIADIRQNGSKALPGYFADDIESNEEFIAGFQDEIRKIDTKIVQHIPKLNKIGFWERLRNRGKYNSLEKLLDGLEL